MFPYIVALNNESCHTKLYVISLRYVEVIVDSILYGFSTEDISNVPRIVVTHNNSMVLWETIDVNNLSIVIHHFCHTSQEHGSYKA